MRERVCRRLGGTGGSRSRATVLREGRNLLRPHPHPVPLRQLHLHLEEPMAGVRGAHPRRVRQVRLAEDGVHPHLAVGIEVGCLCNNQHVIRHYNHGAEDLRSLNVGGDSLLRRNHSKHAIVVCSIVWLVILLLRFKSLY